MIFGWLLDTKDIIQTNDVVIIQWSFWLEEVIAYDIIIQTISYACHIQIHAYICEVYMLLKIYDN